MEKFKIFNQVSMLLVTLNLYACSPAESNVVYPQSKETIQVSFDGLEEEKIGQPFNTEIYIKDDE